MKQLFTFLTAIALFACGTALAQFDSTFATNGIYVQGLGSTTTDAFTEAARQSDGKIVATGYLTLSDGTLKAVVMRFKANGERDSSFATNGMATFSALYNAVFYGLTIQADGKIVVAGYVKPDNATKNRLLVARYNTDGTLDQGYGIGGTVVASLTSYDHYFHCLELQNDGKILAGGQYTVAQSFMGQTITQTNAVIYRFNTDGSIDTSFNSAGYRTFGNTSSNETAVYDIEIYNNKIYFVYHNTALLLQCLEMNGGVVADFNSGMGYSISGMQGSALCVNPDGTIMVVGKSGIHGAIRKVKADGTDLVSNYFAHNVSYSFGSVSEAACMGIHRRSDGYYWVSGYGADPSGLLDHGMMLTDSTGRPVYFGTNGNGLLVHATTTGRDYTAGSIAWDDKVLLYGHANNDQAMLQFEYGLISTAVEGPSFAVRLFPNPAQNILHIAANQPLTGQLLSLAGTVAAHYDGSGMLNIGHLPAGVYLLRLANTQGEVSHQRVVVE